MMMRTPGGPAADRLPGVTIRVAAVEDNGRYREGLTTLLAHAPGFSLGGTYSSAPPALAALAAGSRWDLVLMDLELPGVNGIEATRRIKATAPGIAVVVLTVFEEPNTVLEAICAGADGYLLKRTPPEQLLAELRAIVNGHSPLSGAVARTVLDLVRRFGGAPGPNPDASPPTRLELSDREQEVLRCLVDGMGYKQTAERLSVSLDTVRTYIRRIYGKLQVHSVAEAVSRAVRERLV